MNYKGFEIDYSKRIGAFKIKYVAETQCGARAFYVPADFKSALAAKRYITMHLTQR